MISFSNVDLPVEPVNLHERALVITAQVRLVYMKRIMIDNRSSIDVLYSHSYRRMYLNAQKMDISGESPLYGFRNDAVPVVGTIVLSVVFDTRTLQSTVEGKKFYPQSRIFIQCYIGPYLFGSVAGIHLDSIL